MWKQYWPHCLWRLALTNNIFLSSSHLSCLQRFLTSNWSKLLSETVCSLSSHDDLVSVAYSVSFCFGAHYWSAVSAAPDSPQYSSWLHVTLFLSFLILFAQKVGSLQTISRSRHSLDQLCRLSAGLDEGMWRYLSWSLTELERMFRLLTLDNTARTMRQRWFCWIKKHCSCFQQNSKKMTAEKCQGDREDRQHKQN